MWRVKIPVALEAPSPYQMNPGELSLSGAALAELAEAVLRRGLPFRFQARGWSMAPFIRTEDVISLAPLQGESPRLGDVLAFVHPQSGAFVVHRAVKKISTGWLMRGDGNLTDDDPSPVTHFVGRVAQVERKGKPVWAGLGPERCLIAFLSRRNWLQPMAAFGVRAAQKVLRR